MPQPQYSPKEFRRLRRFFSQSPIVSGTQNIQLSLSESNHLRYTLRLNPGDKCLVTDGRGAEAEARIESFSKEGAAVLSDLQNFRQATVSGLGLYLYPALLQKGKTDIDVRMAQELEAKRFLPVMTERTLLKIKGDASSRMQNRWEKITMEASKQSGSLSLCEVRAPQPLREAVAGIPEHEKVICFHPDKNVKSFRSLAEELTGKENLHLFWGPEGGFSQADLEILKKKGAETVQLGASVLRADTAMIGVIAALRFLFP